MLLAIDAMEKCIKGFGKIHICFEITFLKKSFKMIFFVKKGFTE